MKQNSPAHETVRLATGGRVHETHPVELTLAVEPGATSRVSTSMSGSASMRRMR